MAWRIELTESARRQLEKGDRAVARQIMKFLRERLAVDADPRRFGRALRGEMSGPWRYRVADHRVICDIQDRNVTVLVVRVGHRSTVYGGH